jgi:hypothetical protein
MYVWFQDQWVTYLSGGVRVIQFNSIQFNFINPNGNYKLLSLLRTIEQELKKKPQQYW